MSELLKYVENHSVFKLIEKDQLITLEAKKIMINEAFEWMTMRKEKQIEIKEKKIKELEELKQIEIKKNKYIDELNEIETKIENKKQIEMKEMKSDQEKNMKLILSSLLKNELTPIMSMVGNLTEKLSSSVKKGKFGEETIKSILDNNFKTLEYVDVTKEGHKGDFIVDSNGEKFIIESKYKQKVIKDDIMKLTRDLKENGIKFAILISFVEGALVHIKINGKAITDKFYLYENSSSDIKILFVSDAESKDISNSVILMKNIIEISKKNIINNNKLKKIKKILEISNGLYEDIDENIKTIRSLTKNIKKLDDKNLSMKESIEKIIALGNGRS